DLLAAALGSLGAGAQRGAAIERRELHPADPGAVGAGLAVDAQAMGQVARVPDVLRALLNQYGRPGGRGGLAAGRRRLRPVGAANLRCDRELGAAASRGRAWLQRSHASNRMLPPCSCWTSTAAERLRVAVAHRPHVPATAVPGTKLTRAPSCCNMALSSPCRESAFETFTQRVEVSPRIHGSGLLRRAGWGGRAAVRGQLDGPPRATGGRPA